MLNQLKARARGLKMEAYAIYIAARDPRTPWYAKALIFFVVAHTFSPIDLIPDFIPLPGSPRGGDPPTLPGTQLPPGALVWSGDRAGV